MSGAVFNGRFLKRLLTSGEEDIKRVSTLKNDILRAACKLTLNVTNVDNINNVTCLTVITSLITKSYQQR